MAGWIPPLLSALITGGKVAKNTKKKLEKLDPKERDKLIGKYIRENREWLNKTFSPKQQQAQAGLEERILLGKEKANVPKRYKKGGEVKLRSHKTSSVSTARKTSKQVKGPYS